MPSTRSGGSYNSSISFQKLYRCDYGRRQSVTEVQRADTATRNLSGHLKSQPEGLTKFLAAQRIPNPCRSVETLHELLPDCEKVSEPSHHFQVTQWMAFIDRKEKHDSFNSGMEEVKPPTTQKRAKNSPNSQQHKFKDEKAATDSEQGKRKSTSHKTINPGLHNPKYSAGCHGKCISHGQNHDGITERGGI
ncbi:hypothetical protein O181_040745 [Austropuccinia psidii MF-1]|uniref:Uncharacterized protein n=1 Tax=Austropuccinia psidii MF-1 TaxID=1389203 RepID=A0A9Q3DDQ1_9BASI|nr:hypothetical protein [Austropuccinia psidii MF-1]